MRLLKLLYIADRESLAETGKTITGDQPCAMERGPVLCETYDLIRGKGANAAPWARHVRTDRYDIELVSDPGKKQLSRGDVAKLLEVSKRYQDFDEWAMSELTSKFEEWKTNYPGNKSSAPIPWQDMLRAQGKTDFIETVAREKATREFYDKLFGS